MTKLAIVTGAGQGIGEGIAHRLAKDGFTIAVADINGKTADKVTTDLVNDGYTAKSYHIDVADRERVFELVQKAVADLGELAVYVNNAGVAFIDEIVDSAEKDIRRLLDVNLLGTYWGTQAAAEQFKKQGHGGRIVNAAPWLGLKHLLCRVPIQFQSLAFGGLPKPLQRNWQRTKSLSTLTIQELSELL